MKVLHLPTSVGGQAVGMSRGERAIGFDSRVLSLYGSDLRYPADYAWRLDDRAGAIRLAAHIAAFLCYRSGFDAYHFNYGSSLIHFLNRGVLLWDLPFYASGARKVLTFNGCDARQKYPTMARSSASGSLAACFDAACYGGMCNSGRMDRNRRAAIDKAARHIDHFFVLNPDLLGSLPVEKTSFLPYTVARFAEIAAREYPLAANGQVRIVHAPTERVAKGSRYVLAAVERLKEEFPGRIEMVIIEKQSHEEALRLIATADLFIDQVLIGWYGAAAVEAMKMGIPVVCFINETHLALTPARFAAELPIVCAGPFDLIDRLRPLLRDPEQLTEIGRRSRDFVERWHDPKRLAVITAAVYRGQHPPTLEAACR